jgi:hypothetical protein
MSPAPLPLAATALALALASAAPASAQQIPAPEADPPHQRAIGTDLFLSTDADSTSVVRLGLEFDWLHDGEERRRGVRVERARFDPLGQGWSSRDRLYLRVADRVGGWQASATIGTDGDSILGFASMHKGERFRREIFVEREVLETPQGLSRGLYHTFAGAALDLPADERNLFTLVGGVQEYGGDNVRLHLRANYVHALAPRSGLTAQLRTRWFRNSVPREYDYYSPRWYAQVLPLLQLRRYSGGWRYQLAAGLGVQRDSDSGWRRAGYLQAQVASPPRRGWSFNAAFLYTETPTLSGLSYEYGQLSLGLRRVF